MEKNTKATVSFVIALIALLILLFWPTMKLAAVMFAISTIAAIVAIVLGFQSNKIAKENEGKGKGLATAGIIIGFIAAIWGLLALVGVFALSNVNVSSEVLCPDTTKVSNCVNNQDGTATCKYMNSIDLTCTTDKLVETQYNN